MSRRPALSPAMRRNLTQRTDALRSAERGERPAATAPDWRAATDFGGLPGYEELLAQRRLLGEIGIANPYFRLHDGRAGERTGIAGRSVLNFSSYDYLGLNGHPEVIEAAKEAIDRYGVSSSASRCVAGERPIHLALETAIAEHYEVADSVVLVSGYGANLSVIGQLVGEGDLLVLDEAIHHSVVAGALLSKATRRSFAHNDLDALDRVLHAARGRHHRALIVVEGLYSMDGDFPDLPALIEIKRRHGVWLMVDEAHALGVLGRTGRGIAEQFGVPGDAVDIWMGTLSKTLAACGGFIAGSAELVDYVRALVGGFVYSVAMPPVIAASAAKALEIMHREPERVARLHANVRWFHALARERGLDTGRGPGTAVAPVLTGESLPAVLLSDGLMERGINVVPVLYPAVPAAGSRVRFFITAAHDRADIATAVEATAAELDRATARAEGLRARHRARD